MEKKITSENYFLWIIDIFIENMPASETRVDDFKSNNLTFWERLVKTNLMRLREDWFDL